MHVCTSTDIDRHRHSLRVSMSFGASAVVSCTPGGTGTGSRPAWLDENPSGCGSQGKGVPFMPPAEDKCITVTFSVRKHEKFFELLFQHLGDNLFYADLKMRLSKCLRDNYLTCQVRAASLASSSPKAKQCRVVDTIESVRPADRAQR